MGLADIRATRQQAIEAPLDDAALGAIAATGARARRARRAAEVAGQGVAERDIAVHVRAHMRYAGTDTALVGRRSARRRRRMRGERLRGRAQGALRLHRRGPRSSWSRRCRSRRSAAARKFAEPALRRQAPPCRAAGARDALLLRRRAGTTPPSTRATQLAPGHAVAGPAHHHRAAPDHRGRGRLAGARSRAENHLVLARVAPLPKRSTRSAPRPIR